MLLQLKSESISPKLLEAIFILPFISWQAPKFENYWLHPAAICMLCIRCFPFQISKVYWWLFNTLINLWLALILDMQRYTWLEFNT